jgi:hypothetical protein
VHGCAKVCGQPAFHTLFAQVVLDGADDADSFHETVVGGTGADVFARFAGVAALIGSENGENALIGLANPADFGAGIGGKAISGGASVVRGFGDHVGLDGVETSEFVDDALSLPWIAIEHDAFLYKLHGFLRGGGYLVDARGTHRDLLFNDVTMGGSLGAAEFVGLSVHDTHDAQLDLGRLDALLRKELLDGVLVGFCSGVDGGEVVPGFFGVDGPNGKVGLDLTFDEAFNGDVAVAEARGFDLRAENPAAEDEPESELGSEQSGTARR